MGRKVIWVFFGFFIFFVVTGILSFYNESPLQPSTAFIDDHEIIDELEVDVSDEMIEEINWEVSPEFQAGTYMMRGIENKVGFIDAGFVANQGNKYMWHFWGDHLEGKLSVVAVNENDPHTLVPALSNGEDTYFMWSATELAGPNNRADAHLPSNMELTGSGKWALLVFLGGNYIDHIVVEVE
ncbi:DUF4871 domain-containing protein [Alkalihalobacillus sp. TS-13]|uniref:DUF4871 domain-containing protein n=1 Tax=Alkalihalobacillus sp. TS-13 TaxID=2842455 RepID=UPI001C882506|nr:DUF4871 domain-containing protein [Alkalihalobacillus sp. TS-13]